MSLYTPAVPLQKLAAVEEKVAQERAQRAAKLSEKRAAAQVLSEANQSLLARQFGTVLTFDSAASSGSVSQRSGVGPSYVSGNDQQTRSDSPMLADAQLSGAAIGSQPLPAVVPLPKIPDIASPVEAIRVLAEATGSTTLDELMQKLLSQQDTHRTLTSLKTQALRSVRVACMPSNSCIMAYLYI